MTESKTTNLSRREARLIATAFTISCMTVDEEKPVPIIEELLRKHMPIDDISHDDLCLLSRLFNENATLAHAPHYRINEWLKNKIGDAYVKN